MHGERIEVNLKDFQQDVNGIVLERWKSLGVEYYTRPVYTLTERAKHTSKSKAGWVVASAAGTICKPNLGDFDIVKNFGGDWLCEGGSVSYDGHYWVATLQYTHSPDYYGWDKDLYQPLSSFLKEIEDKKKEKDNK